MMDSARAQEIARELGLDAPPPLRYDDVPAENRPTPNEIRPKFMKALQLVDQIETWAFERFIPSVCAIDQNIDARIPSNPELHFAVCIRTDVPPPSNQKISNATGVRPDDMGKENFYRWLAVEVANMYREVGAVRMGVPLIFRTDGSKKKKGPVPFLGAICKFDRTPPDGQTMESQMANVGTLVPKAMQGTKNVVTPLITGDE